MKCGLHQYGVGGVEEDENGGNGDEEGIFMTRIDGGEDITLGSELFCALE